MAQVVWTNYEKNKVKAILLDAEDASKVSDISFSLKGTSENSTHPGIKPMAPMIAQSSQTHFPLMERGIVQ